MHRFDNKESRKIDDNSVNPLSHLYPYSGKPKCGFHNYVNKFHDYSIAGNLINKQSTPMVSIMQLLCIVYVAGKPSRLHVGWNETNGLSSLAAWRLDNSEHSLFYAMPLTALHNIYYNCLVYQWNRFIIFTVEMMMQCHRSTGQL